MRTLAPLALAALLLACDKHEAKPAEDAAAPPASSVTGALDASPAPHASARSEGASVAKDIESTFTVYVGAAGKEKVTLGIEHRGDEIRAVYVQGYGEPVQLTGKAKSDGSIAIGEKGFLTRKGLHLDATLDPAGKLTGTLTDPKEKTPTKLSLTTGTPFVEKDATFTLSYQGTLGTSTRLRAKWKRDKHLLSGVYRYSRSKEDIALDGTVVAATGAFDLTEKNAKGTVTGKWKGVFVTPNAIVGRWSSVDGSKSYALLLDQTTSYPEVVSLPGGGKLAPQEDYREHGKACRSSVLFPAFDGLPTKTAEAPLNAKLRADMGVGVPLKDEACAGAEDAMPYDMETSYTITAMRPGWVGLEISQYAFTGGAHGMYGATCSIADTTKGALVQLGKELSPDALKKLAGMVNDALKKQNNVTKLTDAGFSQDEVDVTAETSMCAEDEKGTLSLVVRYQPYEVGSWAMGMPSATIAAADAKGLFAPGTMGAAVFK